MIICKMNGKSAEAGATVYDQIMVKRDTLDHDRLLFCPCCNCVTCHDNTILLESVPLADILQISTKTPQLYAAAQIIRDLGMEIGVRSQYCYYLQSKCKVCGALVFDFCSEHEKQEVLVERIHPIVTDGLLQAPNEDMSEDCAKIYREAAAVFPISPRAAAGLMRLCLQQFLVELGITGDKLDAQIGALSRAGVPEFVQQYMDVCRVVGNSGVHPTVEMNVDEDPEIAKGLFQAMNIIVQHLITIPREAKEAYAKLPKGAIKHIEQRDSKNSKQ